MTIKRLVKARVRVHDGQVDTLASRTFCTAAIAGTGGGKTASGYWWLIEAMAENPGLVWIVAEPTEDMLNRVLLVDRPGLMSLPHFLQKFDPGSIFNKTEGMIRTYLGTVILASAHNPDAWQGGQLGGIWLDEAGLMKRNAFMTAVQRLGYYEGRLLITTTPYNLGWLKNDVYDAWVNGDEDYTVVNYSSLANPTYPKKSVDLARRTMSAERFAMLYEGKFGRPEGMIYDCYDEDVHLVDRFDIPATWRRFGGLDYGFNHPTAAVWIAQAPDGRMYIYQNYKRGHDTYAEHAKSMLSLEPESGRLTFYSEHDPEANLEMQRQGLVAVEADKDVLNGIDSVYGQFKTNNLFIFRDLKDVRDEVGSYRWRRHSVSEEWMDEPVKENDDLMDALRYVVHTVTKGSRLKLHV